MARSSNSIENQDKPRMLIPAYRIALHAFLNQVLEGMGRADPFLGEIRRRQTGHRGPVRNVAGPSPIDHPVTSFEKEFLIHSDVVRNTDVDEFIVIILEVVDEYLATIGATFARTASDIAEAVGNSIDAGGQPLSWDLIIDGLEMKEIAFDKDGKINETLVMNPKTAQILASIEMTPEQEQRLNNVLQRKKEEWDAQQRSRRLPRPR